MTAPEVRQAFERWWRQGHSIHGLPYWEPGVYPLWSSHGRRWYMRERMPGTRVWRLEDDMSFELVKEG